MDKQQFDDAIGEPPPSTVDVDAVITRARRASLIRRAASPGVAVAVGVIAVTFGVGAALMPGEPERFSPGGSGPAASGRTVQPTPGPSGAPTSTCDVLPPGVGPPTAPAAAEQPSVAARRLSGVLASALHELVPAARVTAGGFTSDDGIWREAMTFWHVFEQERDLGNGACRTASDYFLAQGDLTDPRGTGYLLVTVARSGGSNDVPTSCADALEDDCQERTGPHGELVVATGRTDRDGGTGGTLFRVTVAKPDGTAVVVDGQNVPGSVKSGRPADRPTPPLTRDQMITLALHPGLTLYP